jgi:heme/copper-type cytochrome/quinol oxidase subunit 3
MEIPYIVNPRKDTGLFNSKIAIWLFLASEVMLFGGFFSAYIFLRLGADYPWPERTLPVLPGLINTFILIGSSVTVVFAWAALKLRNWRQFQIYMSITIACAVLFMVLKGVEYNVKLQHQAVRLDDYSVVEGHLDYDKKDGKKIEKNRINIGLGEDGTVSFDVLRFHADWVEEILEQAKDSGAKLELKSNIEGEKGSADAGKVYFEAGTPLSVDFLKEVKKVHLAARAHNAKLRTNALRQEWEEAKEENPGKQDWEYAGQVSIDMEALSPKLRTEMSTATFEVNKSFELSFKPRNIKEGAEQSSLRDDTVIKGKLLASPMVFHNLDAIDFQHLVMKADEKGIDPETAINNSWLMKNNEFVREAWAWHEKRVDALKKRLIDDYGYKKDDEGNLTEEPKREPTHKELYRIGWKDLAKFGEDRHDIDLSATAKIKEEFMGPNYKARGEDTFPHFSIPREEVGFAAKFSPAWNTYYAIYFTITGLHGLHVIGGALVLAYYLFFGRKMYLENPEWLANRVEVGGLFWHFVDIVWIFAFPILYLM